MTVALLLAAEANAGMCGQLAALGVRRVDLAGPGHGREYGSGLLTVSAAARVAGERVLICVGEGAIPGEVLSRLLGAGGTAVFTGRGMTASPGSGALVVDTPDLEALADAAEWLANSPEAEDPLGALLGELARRGVSTRVLDAGPDGEGACAQLLADPVARDVAKWALARDLSPAALCGISLGLGLIAAVWFTSPSLGAKALGISALAFSFVAGRAGSLVAASGRWSGPALDWLSTASALLAESAIYGALAFSAEAMTSAGGASAGLDGIASHGLNGTFAGTWGGGGAIGVWRLAMAALGMVGIRRLAELCYDRAADGHGLQRSIMRRIEQTITLPAGERYAVIAVTVVMFGPRVTFLVLLCWGAVAIVYLLASRVLGSAVMRVVGVRSPEPQAPHGGIGDLPAYRNDGVLARWIGGIVEGRLPPLLPVLVGLMVTCTLSALGLANLPGILVLTPVEGMLLAALGACHPHDGPRDWLVPPLLMAGEFVFLAALGLSSEVPPLAVFTLLGAVVLRHVDVSFRARHLSGISADRLGLGWDGRMLLLGAATMVGEAQLAYVVLSGYLWVLFGSDFLGGWLADTQVVRGIDDGLIVEEEVVDGG